MSTDANITHQAAIGQFLQAARQFCAWLEKPIDGVLDTCHTLRLLSALYTSAVTLPELDVVQLHDFDRVPSLDAMALAPARGRLLTLPVQYYWEISLALPLECDEPHFSDIVDDLGDVYQDVKEGLLTYQAGLDQLAVWLWRQTWRLHWGAHAVSAIKVLQELVA